MRTKEQIYASNKEWRRNNPGRRKAIAKRQRDSFTPGDRKRICAWKMEWRKRNQAKVNAYQSVRRNIKAGKLVRPASCSACGLICKVQAHHYLGYARENQLNIQWLCISCHEEKHHGK